jgi:hypothetical protein
MKMSKLVFSLVSFSFNLALLLVALTFIPTQSAFADSGESKQAKTKPNIIFILTDDLDGVIWESFIKTTPIGIASTKRRFLTKWPMKESSCVHTTALLRFVRLADRLC